MARSQAHLVASTTAKWDEVALTAARVMLDRLSAQESARSFKEMRTMITEPEAALKELKAEFGCVAPFGSDEACLVLHCPVESVPACADKLRAQGAQMVTVTSLDYVFHTANPCLSLWLQKWRSKLFTSILLKTRASYEACVLHCRVR